MPTMVVFPRETKQYLRNVNRDLKRTTKNSEPLGRQTRLSSNPARPVYQFWEQNLSATCEAHEQEGHKCFTKSSGDVSG